MFVTSNDLKKFIITILSCILIVGCTGNYKDDTYEPPIEGLTATLKFYSEYYYEDTKLHPRRLYTKEDFGDDTSEKTLENFNKPHKYESGERLSVTFTPVECSSLSLKSDCYQFIRTKLYQETPEIIKIKAKPDGYKITGSWPVKTNHTCTVAKKEFYAEPNKTYRVYFQTKSSKGSFLSNNTSCVVKIVEEDR